MLPDPLWRLAPSALTWFVGYLKNTSRLYVLKRLYSLSIKNWKWKIYKVIFNFWFIWSFATSACGWHRKIRTLKENFWHSGYSGRQKNIEQTLKLHQIWTGLWAPDSNYWITVTWSRIRNLTALNTELIYHLRQTREDTLASLYLYRKSRREVDILQSWRVILT